MLILFNDIFIIFAHRNHIIYEQNRKISALAKTDFKIFHNQNGFMLYTLSFLVYL